MGIAILLAVIAAFTFSALHKIAARRRFKKAVAYYKSVRMQHFKTKEFSTIPTVQEFLARNGQFYLLREIDYCYASSEESNASEENIPSDSTELNVTKYSDNELEDDGYESFVLKMWLLPGCDLRGIVLNRGCGTTRLSCQLYSLVEDNGGRLYVNLFEDDVRKTYAADGRHRWFVNDEEVDYSAFIGIHRGADPLIVLRPEQYPASFEEAMSNRFDRFRTENPKFVIAYHGVKGLSYRVISRVVRSDETFSARCHFRWGERRTFRKSGLIEVFDVRAGRTVDSQTFLQKRTRAR